MSHLVERYRQDMSIRGIGKKDIRRLDKEYGEGNWNVTGGKGYAASGTVKQYGRRWDGYRNATVYHQLPEVQKEQTTEEPVQEPEVVEETPPTFTATVLDTGESSNPALFINRFGGNTETMAHSGLKAVKAAEAAGLSIGEIQRMAAAQGVQFGIGAQEYFKEKQGPSPQDMFATQIASMQEMFQQSMQQQQTQYMQMQQAQEERMAALQQQMQQAMVAQQTRPEVAGVKMAQGSAGTPMQIARRGVTGAFGRRGMRISALNV
jgi:hypothetical protein|tara:strand:- start:11146 stop:11934 length:789 start_codon:yes stop_codon:yes gene_type:complete